MLITIVLKFGEIPLRSDDVKLIFYTDRIAIFLI